LIISIEIVYIFYLEAEKFKVVRNFFRTKQCDCTIVRYDLAGRLVVVKNRYQVMLLNRVISRFMDQIR